jgi:hypothetical protein
MQKRYCSRLTNYPLAEGQVTALQHHGIAALFTPWLGIALCLTAPQCTA